MSLILDPINPLQTRVQTRDGRPARIICTDRKYSVCGIDYPIIALIPFSVSGSEEGFYGYRSNGSYTNHPDALDLINVPQKRAGWINVYPSFEGFKSKEEADKYAGPHRSACIKIEYTEFEIPALPNFIRTTDDRTIPIEDISTHSLGKIADAWKDALFQHAGERAGQRSNKKKTQ